MPRRAKVNPPSYLRHSTGQAFVRIDGRNVYLGLFGSPERMDAYRIAVDRWRIDREKSELKSQTITNVQLSAVYAARIAAEAAAPPPDLTVAEAMLEYLEHAKVHYRRADGTATSEPHGIALNLRFLKPYARELAASFGPVKLSSAADAMIVHGVKRKGINQAIGRIKRMFAWLASKGRVPPSVYHSLLCVKGLQYGRSKAAESEPVRPVADEVVDATLPHLTPPVAAMVRFQRATGCRPGEACILRGRDIERTGDAWLYTPAHHKLSYRGHERCIVLGPRVQALLEPLLATKSLDDYVFSPKDARAAKPKSGGRKPKYLKAAPLRKPGACYTTATYGGAIRRAVERA
ncbi:MAG: hypothetical protein ACRDD1_18410, partial [Planctomycetia bacterium]